jgi:hypothetical protein
MSRTSHAGPLRLVDQSYKFAHLLRGEAEISATSDEGQPPNSRPVVQQMVRYIVLSHLTQSKTSGRR